MRLHPNPTPVAERGRHLSGRRANSRLIVFRVGVADLAGMEVRQAVALRGPGGLALISAAGRLWSGFRTMCHACPGPRRGVARKRSERQVLESGMPATVSSCPEHEKEPV